MRLLILFLAISAVLPSVVAGFDPLNYFNFGEARDPALQAEIDGEMVSLDDLNDDVLRVICSHVQDGQAFKSLSSTNRHFQNLTASSIFGNLKIAGDWKAAKRGLQVVGNCPAALEYARSFAFDIFTTFDKGPRPPPRLDEQLVNVLSAMPKLENLRLVIPEYHTDKFARMFENVNLTMPTVKQVVVGSYCDFAIRHCPNVETASHNGWQFSHSQRSRRNGVQNPEHELRLIQAGGSAPKLKYFEMGAAWVVDQLKEVYKYMPQLERLGMPHILDEWQTPADMLPTLACFENLEELILPDASYSNMGFNPPACGNAYNGAGGEEYAKQVRRKGEEAEENIAREVFAELPGLKRLWVGDRSRAEVERGVNGGVTNITWFREKRESPSGWTV